MVLIGREKSIDHGYEHIKRIVTRFRAICFWLRITYPLTHPPTNLADYHLSHLHYYFQQCRRACKIDFRHLSLEFFIQQQGYTFLNFIHNNAFGDWLEVQSLYKRCVCSIQEKIASCLRYVNFVIKSIKILILFPGEKHLPFK